MPGTAGLRASIISPVDLYRANSPDSLVEALQHLLPGRIAFV